ncbi:hypothetical protein COU91_01465 [Candidatus Saccharibacteria bacterium CG10_big_fil_rev_8_21_14_0_10_47_8]|nr:MAG: hypothetical protein COU91_01465 [Candidatus Saccharibacteria bacterium CG10_big_fil_rev_8_21_14_0_10_47_8]
MKESQPSPNDASQHKFSELRASAYHTSAESDAELHERYITLTSKLIERIVGKDSEPFDTVIFLDKSARPLSWMLRQLWPHIASERLNPDTGETEVVPMPDVKFANIDRLQWREDPTIAFDGDNNRRVATEADIESLRSIFTIDKQHNLDDRRILVVDEQSETGDTLTTAVDLFSQAFPTSTVDGAAWIRHGTVYDPTTRKRVTEVKEIPVWYPRKNDQTGLYHQEGRGIFDPVPTRNRNTPERYLEGSWKFTGTAPWIRKADAELSDDEQAEIRRLQEGITQSEDTQTKNALQRRIETIQTYYDPRSLALRNDIGHMVLNLMQGRLFPMMYTDRQELFGKQKNEYLRANATIRGRRKRQR